MKDASILRNNGVNIEKSLELFGDMETYDETLNDFLAEVDEKLANIKKYKEQGDMANYAILVHSLKSDARYFGFEKLAELAYNHEMESKANNMYYVTDHYDELMAEANKIVTAVKAYKGVIAQPQVQAQAPVMNEQPNLDQVISAHTMVQAAPQLDDKTILVVDDSNVVRSFVSKIFSNDYGVVSANDGAEALALLKTNIEKIECMLLDLNMPNVDGFQVLDYFKDNNLFNKVPVAIITGEGSQDNVKRAYTYPIIDMLQKPFNEVNVKNIVDKLLMVKSMNDEASRGELDGEHSRARM